MLIHQPRPSRPTTPPMRESRELSRSEQLLRDALLRDDARTPPPRTPTIYKTSPRVVREKSLPESSGYSSEKRRHVGAYGGDSEFSAVVARERERSPSPTPHPRRRQSLNRSSFSPRASSPYRGDFIHPTTHEVVLRTRLEGVLMTARSIQDCLERTGSPDIMTNCSSCSDSTDSIHRSSHNMQIPPTPSTSSSVYIPVSRVRPGARMEHPEQEDYDDKIEAQMLTPPPTPPYLPTEILHSPHPLNQTFMQRKPSKRQRSDPLPAASPLSSPPLPRSPSSPHVHTREYGGLTASPASPRPQFNARTASAQCKDMPGYVSFAAIEGLGAPDNLDCDDDDRNGSGQGKDRSSGLWGFLGRKKN